MYNKLEPLIPTPMPRDRARRHHGVERRGRSARRGAAAAWTVVQEDSATFDIHVLWDTPDLDAAMDAALLHGQAFFGPNMTAGAVIATLNSADNAISKRYGNLGWITKPF